MDECNGEVEYPGRYGSRLRLDHEAKPWAGKEEGKQLNLLG